MTDFFTSDLHLGHKKILILGKGRPFSSIEEHDETIIHNWNERVGYGDTVHVVGDFAWKDMRPYLRRLHGFKHLYKGNHDHSKPIKQAVKDGLWTSVQDIGFVYQPGLECPVTLCHYAMRVWPKSHHGALHFYGHSHGNLPGDSQSLDVGVDCWKYRPVTLEEIQARLAKQMKRHHPDHHRPKDEAEYR